MTMTSSKKKEQERFYLDLFRSAFPLFPEGLIEDGESPDFVINASDGTIGIELVRVYQQVSIDGPPPQAQESERQALVEESRRIYEAMDLDPVQVHFFLAGDTNFTKKNRKKYARVLAELVARNLPPQNSWLDLENQYDLPESFPSEVHSVNIVRFDSLTHNAWSVAVGGLVQEDCRTNFQKKISEKDALLQSYRHCTMHWLLIVAEWSGPSSFFEPSTETLTHKYHAQFERIFFLNPTRRQFVELPVERSVR
jgi:hypothetical protein